MLFFVVYCACRWSCELQHQERIFLHQAGLVGQWDSLLQRNGERIITLNEQVETIQTEQKRSLASLFSVSLIFGCCSVYRISRNVGGIAFVNYILSWQLFVKLMSLNSQI